jgi:putative ABC transport system permease protein
MDALTEDIRQAFRAFRDHLGFTATALVTLMLGIGVNTAIFSVLSAVLLKPLPFPDPDRLVLIMQSFRAAPTDVWSSPAEVVYWQSQSDMLEDVAAWKTVMFDYAAGDVPLTIRTGTVTEGYFRALRTSFVAGRGFAPEEDRPGAGKTVVISHAFWARRLNGDAEILGKAISLNGEPHTVIGITSADFDVHDLDIRGTGEPELWVPLQLEPNTTDIFPDLDAFARLRDGVTQEVARQRVAASGRVFRERFPDDSLTEWGYTTLPLREAIVRDARPMLLVLTGAVALVLLISCANVASLLLARATSRSREVAIRSALGAGRWRIMRQLLTESAVLSLTGGALGLLAGALGMRWLLSIGLIDLPRLAKSDSFVAVDWRVSVFTLVLAIATGLLVGIAPALASSRADLTAVIKDAGGPASAGGRRHAKTLSLLVTIEVALAVVLMIGAGLLIRTSIALSTVELGFSVDNVLTMQSALSEPRSTATVARTIEAVLTRIRAIPGVDVAASSVGSPLQHRAGGPFDIVGRQNEGPATGAAVFVPSSPDYFETLRIPLLVGRTFAASDDQAALPVTVINQAMAEKYWGDGTDPLQDRIQFGAGIRDASDEPARQIIGIVGSIRQDGIMGDSAPAMYVPHAQISDKLNNGFPPALDWIIRTNNDPGAVSALLHKALREETRQQVTDIRLMKDTWLLSISRQRLNLWLMTLFGAAALLLGAIGVYGLVAYSVQQRTHEIGIRLALGAHADAVRSMVVRQGIVRILAGVGVGVFAAYFLAYALASSLFGVEPHDLPIFLIVPLLLLAVGGAAVYVPALRATRIDPTVALRCY